ncbi:CPBP family intramembrane glutamic endopeptidase [Nocardiopsis composta]|uniref:Membrane protease YdiL (CAAX protease family) n=1 Tax=Nocardiopsis composta TaxID=157465 RepID=A0A7W8VBQ6_9ACTN|nr:CPBP family glutamic-type intramembrane protease [Nocardiopsis composta]MBB5430377.1 membrane protease YdiL (CAAX protease family) [Nocardiopsis composta]
MPSTTPPTGTAPYLRRRLWLFAASCLLITWLPWTALAAVGADVDEGLAMPVFTLAACGPSLAALAMWLRHRRELPRDRVRVVAAWPLLSVLLGAAPMLLVSVLAHWNGLEAIPRHAASVAAGVGGPAGVVAYTLLAGPLSEEFGWRGYVQPRLRTAFGRARTAVLLGAAWALWHVPLFFLQGTEQHETGLLTLRGAVFFATFLPLSYIILFACEYLEGGVWAAVLVHAAWNATDALVPEVGDAGHLLRSAFTLALAIAVAAVWRRRRPDRGRRPPAVTGEPALRRYSGGPGKRTSTASKVSGSRKETPPSSVTAATGPPRGWKATSSRCGVPSGRTSSPVAMSQTWFFRRTSPSTSPPQLRKTRSPAGSMTRPATNGSP